MKKPAIYLLLLCATFLCVRVLPLHAEEVTYTYDDLNRLVQAETVRSGEEVGITYAYDEVGNREGKSVTTVAGAAPAEESQRLER